MGQEVLGGRYRLESLLGSGGMAKVYRAQDTQLDRTVAVKILSSQFAQDPSFVERFRREAKMAAKLNHPNIVGVYDSGSDGETQWIVMELVEGRTLEDFLSSGGRLSPIRGVELIEKVAEAVAAAHAQGVINRDIKPGNIMVTRDGAVKVMDFGIARLSTTTETLAQTAQVLGTAAYLSPEQAQGKQVDARSDIYSLGCVAYELLAGSKPFDGDTAVAVAYKHVQETPPPPTAINPELTPEIDAVVMKAMAKNPDNRYQTATELRDDLMRLREGKQVSATPLLPAAAATQVIGRPSPATTSVLEPQDEGMSTGKKWMIGILIALAVLAILGGGAYLLSQSVLGGDETTTRVTVPNVVGDTLEVATRKITDAGLVVADPVIERVAGSEDPDTVLAQEPQNGAEVPKGSEVTLTVAKEELNEIPSVATQSAEEAKAILEGDPYFFEVTKSKQSSESVTAGNAIGTVPAAGEKLKPGEPITLLVSNGPEQSPTVFVPEVTCLSEGKATNTLSKEGLSIDVVGTRPANPSCPQPNKIAEQNPSSGTEVARGTVVRVWTNAAPPSPSPT